MQEAGLGVTGMRMDDFAKLAPDQKQWIVKLQAAASESVCSFFRRLGYEDKAEYCSMWLCIILCSEVLNME